MTIFGVDVSTYQSAIDWRKAKAYGIDFMVARASLGLRPDSKYAAHTSAAVTADVIPGAYHYLWPGVDSAKAVERFLDIVGPTEGKLLVLDVEHRGYGAETDVIHAVRDWVNELRKHTAHPLVIYTGTWFWDGRMRDPDGTDFGPLWQSRYVTVDKPPEAYRSIYARVPASWWKPGYGGWPEATILQFTSKGKVSGYAGRLDVDAFRGSRDDLLALTHDLPDTSTGDMPGLLITDVVPFSGKVTLTKPWKAWNVDTDTQTGEPIAADGVYRPVASCKYHNGLPGYLITNNNRLLVLPAGESVGLKVEPDPAPDLAAAIAADRAKARIVWG